MATVTRGMHCRKDVPKGASVGTGADSSLGVDELVHTICKVDSVEVPATHEWMRKLSVLFSSLESHVQQIDPSGFQSVLKKTRISSYLSDVYAIRSRWEGHLETCLARRAICADSPISEVRAAVNEKIGMLVPEFFDALVGRERILFVGSGPYPTTAMAIASVLKCSVTCLDHSKEANEIGQMFVAAGGMSGDVSIVQGSLEAFEAIGDFDAVVTAFLVGVDTRPRAVDAKSELIQSTVRRVAPGARLILRTTIGAGTLIYPAVEPPNQIGVQVQMIPEASALPVPYDRPLMLIDRSS